MQTQKNWLLGLLVVVPLVGCSLAACLAGAVLGGTMGARIGYSLAERRAPVLTLSPPVPEQEPAWPEPPGRTTPDLEMRMAARVTYLTLDGPADQAGVQIGDLILAVDDQEVSLRRDLVDIIRDYKPNDRVVLIILRNGRDERVRVRLGSRRSDDGQVVAALGLEYRLEPVMPMR